MKQDTCSFVWRLAIVVWVCATAIVGRVAADYRNKPIRIIVPSAPGGGTDTTMRIVSPKLGEILGQRVLLDNRRSSS